MSAPLCRYNSTNPAVYPPTLVPQSLPRHEILFTLPLQYPPPFLAADLGGRAHHADHWVKEWRGRLPLPATSTTSLQSLPANFRYSGRKITDSERLGNVAVRWEKDGKSKRGAWLLRVCLSMYSITENIYCSQLSSVAILLKPEPVSHRIVQVNDCFLSLCAIVLRSPPASHVSTSNGQWSSQLFCVHYKWLAPGLQFTHFRSQNRLRWLYCNPNTSNLYRTPSFTTLYGAIFPWYYLFNFLIFFFLEFYIIKYLFVFLFSAGSYVKRKTAFND
jgi:hypothetical protein